MVRPFDRAFVTEACHRLQQIRDDATPNWGRMNPAQLHGHLRLAYRYSLAKEPLGPDEGGIFGHYIIGPLILNGWVPMPKNVKAPKMYHALPTSTVDAVQTEIEEFFERYSAGTLPDVPHPYFGPYGVKGWAKLHVLHTEHHMRQFGV